MVYQISSGPNLLKTSRPPSLFDQVLELEPWDTTRHTSVGEAWEECGRRVPGFLKGCGGPGWSVRRHIVRMGRQLNDPTAKTTWKTYPEVMRRVEDVVGKMAATRRYTLGPQQQHGVVEPKKTDLATSETAHASPGQPATALERQQQAAVESQKSTLSAAVASSEGRWSPICLPLCFSPLALTRPRRSRCPPLRWFVDSVCGFFSSLHARGSDGRALRGWGWDVVKVRQRF